ncbi:hypothetical protein I5M32_00265 [Pedobacter sp. SD-b]|uniref:Uncharacterized protein n=1 Tax=Pedobacter segetis TaxID=2793069 RepID=A0ABS1BEU2_9SPHI|nr:hypothetical protein [Pedobacter segetis]MBK0381377.1 hypothetical protein [Pedobacter segetis]
MKVFGNTFLVSYQFSYWQLKDEIAELIDEKYPNFEIVITEVDKADLFYFKEADRYVNYFLGRELNKTDNAKPENVIWGIFLKNKMAFSFFLS